MKKTIEVDDMITMNQIAKELKLSKATLQFYLEQGLIKPEGVLASTYVFSRKKHIPLVRRIRRQTARGIKILDVVGQMEEEQ